jgi:MFS family permease
LGCLDTEIELKCGLFPGEHVNADNSTGEAPVQGPRLRRQLGRFRRQINPKQTFSSLRHPNYRLWFRGQMVSLFGTWMQITAQAFLVYDLTHSSAYLGFVGFAAGAPTWLFMAYGGVVADRVRRRKLLLVTQSSMMVLAFILSALTFLHVVRPWHIIILAFLLGVANAFDAPARHSFVPEMVDREDLTNAIALNSTIFNSATAVGPAVAGITYALFGPAWCFLINGLSFIAVIVALGLMKLRPLPLPALVSSPWQDLKEGFRYVLSDPIIRAIVALVMVTSMFGTSFAVLIPAWAVEILHGNATTNGWLQSARGIGALCGALLIASLGRFTFRGRMLTLGTFSFPVLLVAFSLIRWLPFSLALIFGVGAANLLIFNLANALVQTHVTDSLRGRVMGLYSLTFFGFLPIGALWIGQMADRFSEPIAMMTNALIMFFFTALIWMLVPKLRTLS